jgi:small subunit ribosomal protein S13
LHESETQTKTRIDEVKMARIAGITLPPEKRIEVGLTYIYGIGRSKSNKILEEAKIDRDKKVKTLTEDEINSIRQIIEKHENIEGDLRKNVTMDIKRLMDIGSYRGMRHKRRLPVRGQRTKTNARTRKGPRGQTVRKK